MLKFHILTLFPEALRPYLETSMLRKAAERKLVQIKLVNPRDFTLDKHHKADDRPYGGGPGMVLKAEPILRAISKLEARNSKQKKSFGFRNSKFVLTSPRGKQFTNAMAAKWAKQYEQIVIIAGHYEGIDARVKKILKAEEISVGPYTLTGGEVPALVMVDAITRRLPGVLGKEESLEEKRIAPEQTYTRPEILTFKGKKYRVPKVLLSGHAANIAKWREGAG
ncbi:MAG TPA: tRNA (guanosine(37)-N1)-methyltransferase TrmD [Candidatus Paceibacterota bacterium]